MNEHEHESTNPTAGETWLLVLVLIDCLKSHLHKAAVFTSCYFSQQGDIMF